MPTSYAVLGDALSQDSEESVSRLAGKRSFLALASFFVGLGFAALWIGGATPQLAAQSPVTFMALPSTALRGPASSYSIASLPGPSALKNLVVRELQARSGQCRPLRDVTVKAGAELAKTGDEKPYAKLMFSPIMEPASKEKVKDMAGVSLPLGLFDPLGISTKVPEGQLLFYREAELKHGRVCMLAVLGLAVGERHDFIPLLGSGIDKALPAYLFGTPAISETPAAQFWPIALGALFMEELRHEYDRKNDPNASPGDYGWDPLGLKPKDEKGFKELQTKELNNGRLAMFAAAGIIAQEMLTGQKILPLNFS
jgi:hypothetical protein